MHNKINQDKLNTQKMYLELQNAKREEELSLSQQKGNLLEAAKDQDNDGTLNLDGDFIEL